MKYEFRVTSNQGTWEYAQAQCGDMGGQLISQNLGNEGRQYHKFVMYSFPLFKSLIII